MWGRLIAKRKSIGILSLVCMITGALLLLAMGKQQGGLSGTLLRAGLVLGALWGALPRASTPEGKTFSNWQILGFLSIIVAVVYRPWVVIPLVIILGILSLFARHRT